MILSRQLRAHTSTKHRPYSPKSLKCMGNTCCCRLSGPRKFVLRRTGPGRTSEGFRMAKLPETRRRRKILGQPSHFHFFPLPVLSFFLLRLNEPRLTLTYSYNATVGMTRRDGAFRNYAKKLSLPYAVASNRTERNMRSADDYTR